MFCGRPGRFGPPPPRPDFGRGFWPGPPRGGRGEGFNFRGGFPTGPHGGPPSFHPVPDCGYEEFGCPSQMPAQSRGRGRGRGRGHHANNNNGQKKQKAEKMNKKDLPENNAFYCDVCDRGYKVEDKFKEHVDQHIKCNVDKCTYVASPKLVKLHYDFQHRTGLAKKIWSLESAEDIQKWRDERKKNFPTVDNIAKKKLAQDAQYSRGEVIETKQFGKMRGGGRGRGRGRGRGGRNDCHGNKRQWNERHDSNHQQNGGPEQKKMKTDVQSRNPVGVKPHDPTLDPLSYVLEEKKGSDEDKPRDIPNKKLELCGGLGSLISSYGDMTDSNSEEEEDPPVKMSAVDKPVVKSSPEKLPASRDMGRIQSSPRSQPDVSPPKPREMEMPRPRQWPPKRNRSGRKNRDNRNNRPQPGWKKAQTSTLLEKLLAPNIRHERNVILQCVRYIVNNNFFGIGQKTETVNNDKISELQSVPMDEGCDISQKIKGENGEELDNVNSDTVIEDKAVVDEDIWESGVAIVT